MQAVDEKPEKAETFSTPEEILNVAMLQENAETREVFVDEGSFPMQCVPSDPEAEVQICS